MATQGRGSVSEQVVAYLSYPFASCFPSSSRHAAAHETQGLLSEASYDDSDAISLLSNIANRSRRRSRSSRRREEWNKRAAVLGCGLFGRPKGQIQRREVTSGDGLRSQHRRDGSGDSAASLGAESDDEGGPAQSLTGSFGAGQDSGDEDAGMLGDEDIAEISQSREEEEEAEGGEQQGGGETAVVVPTVHVSEPVPDDEAALQEEQKEAEERAAIKAKLAQEAEEYARAEAEDASRRAAEEEALAAEEEAAIAKAKRRAERRAIKEGLARVRTESQRERRRTEAEAEAAAGGFDFAEEEPQEEPPMYDGYREEEQEGGYGEDGGDYPSPYGLANGPEGYGYHDQYHHHQNEYPSPHLQQQQEVVHHHHFYHEPHQEEEETYDDRLLSPNFRLAELPGLETSARQDAARGTAMVEEDEDDADIAGITFSKGRKGRARGEGGSNSYSAGRSNGSGSGSRQSGSASGQRQVRYEAHRKGSDQSAEEVHGAGSSSASAKKSYRDRPRRHERTGSRSTGSGTGARLREGVPSRAMATSPTIPEAGDQRADAAAGGFDDFVPAPEQDVEWQSGSTRGGHRARERYADNTSTGSSGPRRERRREGPSGGGLNMPRNPGGANVFVQGRQQGGNPFQ